MTRNTTELRCWASTAWCSKATGRPAPGRSKTPFATPATRSGTDCGRRWAANSARAGEHRQMKELSVGILGVGRYSPERRLTNRDLEQMVDTSDEWIVTRTGIRERRIAAPHEATSDLACAAAVRALDAAGVAAEEVDLIIVATITPDMFFPSTACLVQDRLGARNAAAFDVSAACSGFI